MIAEQNWKQKLTKEQYAVTRQKATEAPFSGKFLDHHETGLYTCCNCNLELFSSDAKFDSHTGWPSFDDPVSKENVELVEDYSLGMHRIEVICKRCKAHLGHVFDDGPTKTGQRFCINSAALEFKKRD